MEARPRNAVDAELAEVLLAISAVSRKLAADIMKLKARHERSQESLEAHQACGCREFCPHARKMNNQFAKESKHARNR